MTPQELQAWRWDLGVSQMRLAEELGITARAIQYYESGERPIPPLLPPALKGVRSSLRANLQREARRREVFARPPARSGQLTSRRG